MTDVERATRLLRKYYPHKTEKALARALERVKDPSNKRVRIMFRQFPKSDLSSVLRHCTGKHDLSLPATAALVLARRINQTK